MKRKGYLISALIFCTVCAILNLLGFIFCDPITMLYSFAPAISAMISFLFWVLWLLVDDN